MSLYYNGSTITKVPLDVLSTELSIAFSLSNQFFYNIYNFYSGVISVEGKKFAVILFCGTYFLRIARKPAKIAKIRNPQKFTATRLI